MHLYMYVCVPCTGKIMNTHVNVCMHMLCMYVFAFVCMRASILKTFYEQTCSCVYVYVYAHVMYVFVYVCMRASILKKL